MHCSLEAEVKIKSEESALSADTQKLCLETPSWLELLYVFFPGLPNSSTGAAHFTVFFTTLSSHSEKPPHMKDCVAEIAKLSSTWANIQARLWRDEPSLRLQLQKAALSEMQGREI